MLQERDERRGHADELHRGHVHIGDILRRLAAHALAYARFNALVYELPFFVQVGGRLRDMPPLFAVRRQILNRGGIRGHIGLDRYHLLRQRRDALDIPFENRPALSQ